MENPRIVSAERGGEVVHNEALESFKSMFNFLKGKRDTDIKVFHDKKVFTRADLIELNQKVQDKLHLHNIQGNLVSISITFSDSDVKTFGNWGAFEAQEWNHSCYTESIVIEWEFSIIFPNHTKQIPQPHSMRVRIGAGLRPNEIFQVVMTGAEDYELSEVMADVIFKIDYVNTQLSSELKHIVADWHSALPNNVTQGIVIRLAKRHNGKIELLLNFLFIATSVFVINLVLSTGLHYLDLKTIPNVFRWGYFYLSASFPIFFVIWKVSDFFSERIIRTTIGRFKKAPMIRLTRGDHNRLNDVNGANRKLVNDLAQKVAVTLIIALLFFVIRDLIPLVIKTSIGIFMGK